MQIHELGTRTPGVYDYAALDTGSQTYKAQVGNLKPEYTSYDSANPTSWADVATMGSNTPISTFFERVTYIARNVRYLWKLIGSGDFSNVAETISGAIGNTALGTTATTLSGAIAEHESDISTINGNLSELNSNLSLGITYVANDHVSEAKLNRCAAWKRGNMLFFRGNIEMLYASGFTDFVQIGTISGWNAVSITYNNTPSQGDGSKVACFSINASGGIFVYSSTAYTGAPFFRFSICVPVAN